VTTDEAQGSGLLITADSLANLPVLSFEAQPYLRDLFEAVHDDTRPLAIVVGAGASMNSGLPSWSVLIDNLIRQIGDEAIQTMAFADQSDSLRKAELVLQLLKQQEPAEEEHTFIRKALYPKQSPLGPGFLTQAIARLVAARSGPVYLLTTNWDTLLEDALTPLVGDRKIKIFSKLEDYQAWKKYCDRGNIGVLHLHGALPPKKGAKKPVILTQSHFLKYGAQVRKQVSDVLSVSNTLFVGVSLTDPNLVGPLYDLRDTTNAATGPQRFAVACVDLDPRDEERRLQQARFAVTSVEFLNNVLRLRPILLKSFGQMVQLISDLGLHCGQSDEGEGAVRATSDKDSRPGSYGGRLRDALDLVYSYLGADQPPHHIVGEKATDLTRELGNALTGPGGIRDLLMQMSAKYRKAAQGNREEEHFGLFLWLRTFAGLDSEPEYSLRLVGSSVYESREPWYMNRTKPIVGNSPYASVASVYLGRTVKTNLNPNSNSDIWAGVLAVPLVLAGITGGSVNGEDLDRIVIGSVTLDSTHLVENQKPSERRFGGPKIGVLAELDASDVDQLCERIQAAVLMALALN
jgi:hypothetical protein